MACSGKIQIILQGSLIWKSEHLPTFNGIGVYGGETKKHRVILKNSASLQYIWGGTSEGKRKPCRNSWLGLYTEKFKGICPGVTLARPLESLPGHLSQKAITRLRSLAGRPSQEPSTLQRAKSMVKALCEIQDSSQGSGAFSICEESCSSERTMTLRLELKWWLVGMYLYSRCRSGVCCWTETAAHHYSHPGQPI